MTDFVYGSRTNNFAAVNAYYHVDRFFELVEDLGFPLPSYFGGTTFPMPGRPSRLADVGQRPLRRDRTGIDHSAMRLPMLGDTCQPDRYRDGLARPSSRARRPRDPARPCRWAELRIQPQCRRQHGRDPGRPRVDRPGSVPAGSLRPGRSPSTRPAGGHVGMGRTERRRRLQQRAGAVDDPVPRLSIDWRRRDRPRASTLRGALHGLPHPTHGRHVDAGDEPRPMPAPSRTA